MIFYDCEEIAAEFNGLGRIEREFPEWLRADVAILGEPSDGFIEAGCQGTLRVRVIAAGVRAHTARSLAGRQRDSLPRARARTARRGYRAREVDIDGCVYREGLSAVGISGGIAGNVVPDEAVVTINYRFAPDRTVDAALAHVRAVFAGLDVTVELADGAPGALPVYPRLPPPSSSGPRAAGSAPNTAGPTSPASPPSASRR